MVLEFTHQQTTAVFDFLKTLDCYIGKQAVMEQEISDFMHNPNRQIAALVCQNITEKLTYEAPYIRILYVLSGSIEIHLDGRVKNYAAGCLVMANEFTQIDYIQTSPHTEVLSFLFKKEYFTDVLLNQFVEESMMYRFFVENAKQENPRSNYFLYQFSPEEDVHHLALLLLKQVVKMKYANNKITKAAFTLFIVEISECTEKNLVLKDSTVSSSVLINEILAYIETNYTHITLNTVAERFYFHPNYLSALIKEQVGVTFSQYLMNYRLERASTYLEQTDLPIQDIIEKVGYRDKTFFFKIFKNKFEQTPLQYRKNIQNKSVPMVN